MRLTARDGIATLFVAAAAVVFILWTTGAAMAGLSTRVITVVVFALGWFACIADQRAMAAVYGANGGRRSAPLGYVVLTVACPGGIPSGRSFAHEIARAVRCRHS